MAGKGPRLAAAAGGSLYLVLETYSPYFILLFGGVGIVLLGVCQKMRCATKGQPATPSSREDDEKRKGRGRRESSRAIKEAALDTLFPCLFQDITQGEGTCRMTRRFLWLMATVWMPSLLLLPCLPVLNVCADRACPVSPV